MWLDGGVMVVVIEDGLWCCVGFDDCGVNFVLVNEMK